MELCNKNIYLHKSGPKEKNIRIHEVDPQDEGCGSGPWWFLILGYRVMGRIYQLWAHKVSAVVERGRVSK